MRTLIIKGGLVIDPKNGLSKTADVLIEGGTIVGVDAGVKKDGAEIIDAAGKVVCPGFIDLHCHLREPGFEYKETIATGTLAAARGGFTTVCAMPNTDPVTDSRAIVDFVLAKAVDEGVVRVLPIGAVTKESKGVELAELGELADAQVVGFSDDGHPVSDANIMRQALLYASSIGLPVINHCEVKSISVGGHMNEGWVATRLGLKGIPNSAEAIMVARDIELAELTGGHVHIAHASTKGTIDMVRRAKESGINVTCEVTPHHLTITDEAIMGHGHDGDPYGQLKEDAYDSDAKVLPPLRARADVEAMVLALKEGVIDFIATDHAPHGTVDKQTTFADAANGISNLETALGSLLSLVHSKDMDLVGVIEKLTVAPARFLGRDDIGSLNPGSSADVTIIDTGAEWVVETSQFASKGRNTPLAGAKMCGKVETTIYNGNIVT